jgi:hypothetical protein
VETHDGTAQGASLNSSVGDYFDPICGRSFVVAQPGSRPDLWVAYLAGARASYRMHGVESVLELDDVRDGSTTALFIAVVESDGRVVGGLRVQGPYERVEQASALREWAGRDGSVQMRRQIARRLREGVIEVKAVWVAQQISRRGEVTAALARAFVHCLNLMDVRYAMCTAASHTLTRWQTSGGRVSADVRAVAFPDSRYQTRLVWWDREAVLHRISTDQLSALRDEAAQLLGPNLPSVRVQTRRAS